MSPNPVTKTEKTRQQIITTAYALFIRQGYHGTSMRQIAREAKIALGSIYNHFDTKENLFEAIFYTYHPYQQLIPAIQQTSGDTVEVFVRNLASRMVEILNNSPEFLNLVFIDFVEFQNKYTRSILEKNLHQFIDVYQRISQVDNSRLRPIPPFILIRSFFSLFFSYFVTGVVIRSAPETLAALERNAFDYFVDIYLHGILVTE
ncbi:MAG: TetR/AcrR family transcriptional regulator [Anaerolineae bacterium]|nr:TetR/AcrR family transcriptional regulator [Anaerolineae bacterium]